MINVLMACGCKQKTDGDTHLPFCVEHNEHRIARVDAPAPRFTGFVKGPTAKPENLEPWGKPLRK